MIALWQNNKMAYSMLVCVEVQFEGRGKDTALLFLYYTITEAGLHLFLI